MADQVAQLPPFLRRSVNQVLDEQYRQQKLRELHLPKIRQAAAEQKYARAILVEKAIRGNLEQIDPEQDPETYKVTRLQLAEVLAEQGDFQQAAELAAGYADIDTLDHYQSMEAAVNADDDESCDCEEQQVRGRSIPNKFVAGEVYSRKHQRIMPLVMCGKCGFGNVRQAPAETDLSHVEKH